MRRGRLFAVVGPSGAGKDTVMAELVKARSDLHWVQRAITRPAAQDDEPFETVSPAEFETRVSGGQFVLHWKAHGLQYGVPISVRGILDAGKDGMVNLSRNVLEQAAEQFPGLHVLNITAGDEVRAERLAARGRESAEDIAKRIARAVPPFAGSFVVTDIDNSGALKDSVAACLQVMDRVPV